jgi:hypothetical protein
MNHEYYAACKINGTAPPTEKKNLVTNLEVVSTLIRTLQDSELHLLSEKQEMGKSWNIYKYIAPMQKIFDLK